MNITIGFNADDVIFKMRILILASQRVLAVFFYKIFSAKPEKKPNKNMASMEKISKYRCKYLWKNIELIDIDMQH